MTKKLILVAVLVCLTGAMVGSEAVASGGVEDFPTTHDFDDLPGLNPAPAASDDDEEEEEEDDPSAAAKDQETADDEPLGVVVESKAEDDDKVAVEEDVTAEEDADDEPPTIDESRQARRGGPQESPEEGSEELVSDDADGVPSPHHGPTFWRQMRSGALMTFLSLGAGAGMTYMGSEQNNQGLEDWGVALMFFGPLVGTPIAVNASGNRIYENQYMGAFVGNILGIFPALIGGALAVAIVDGAAAGASDGALLLSAGLAGGGILTWATVEGYHRQLVISNWMEDRRAEISVSPVHVSGPSPDDFGAGLGISGRF